MSNQPTASTIRIYGQHDSFSKQDWQLMKGEVNGILSCEYPPQMMLFARNTNNFSMIRATAAVRGFSPDGSQLAPCADPENVIFGLFGTNGGPNAWIKAVSASDKSKTMGILTSIAPHPPSSYPINKSTYLQQRRAVLSGCASHPRGSRDMREMSGARAWVAA